MKVFLSKPRYHWISPYTVIEKIVFWRDIKYDEPMVEFWHDILLPISVAVNRVLDFIHPEVRYIKIDRWDTWSMDSTLTPIILPMLRQLRNSKHGSPNVEDEDVPEHLRSTAAPPKKNEWDTDDLWHERWNWVMDQMIWSFEQLDSDWESQFHTGKSDIYWEKIDEYHENPITGKMEQLSEMKRGPNDTHQFDAAGYQAHSDRIDLGLRLFGKYFRALWD